MGTGHSGIGLYVGHPGFAVGSDVDQILTMTGLVQKRGR